MLECKIVVFAIISLLEIPLVAAVTQFWSKWSHFLVTGFSYYSYKTYQEWDVIRNTFIYPHN